MIPLGGAAGVDLRDRTMALCRLLREEVSQFRTDRAGRFERLEHAYKTMYQPQGLALANALLQYVPAGNQKTGVMLKITKDDVKVFEYPLIEDVAATQLQKL